jgi:hypothetical protein
MAAAAADRDGLAFMPPIPPTLQPRNVVKLFQRRNNTAADELAATHGLKQSNRLH